MISFHTITGSLNDNVTDTDDDSDLVPDDDPGTFNTKVRSELKNSKAQAKDKVFNDILKKTIGTSFHKYLARAFTLSLKLGFIPYVWKVAVLSMLIKTNKPPSQTTSYQPISLLSAIMKLFERVIENILKTMVSLASISQALEIQVNKRPPFLSLSDNRERLQSGQTCNSGLS